MVKIETKNDGEIRIDWEDGDIENHELTPGDTFKIVRTGDSSWIYFLKRDDLDEIT